MLLTAQNVLVRPVHALRSASSLEMEWSKGHYSDSEVVVHLYHQPNLAYWLGSKWPHKNRMITKSSLFAQSFFKLKITKNI